MKLFNYLRMLGAFTNAYQRIPVSAEPKDRQERKMLDEAQSAIASSWTRRLAWLEKRRDEADEAFDLEAERAAFFPTTEGDKVVIPLQFLQDFMVRKMAAVQNNVSIHNPKEVAEVKEVFNDYGVELTSEFKGLTFNHINWSAREAQKPKLMVHAKEASGEEVCIRFEAAGELCQKFLNALLFLELKPGHVFDLSVEAVDPAIAKNAKAGKKVAELGKYVNHNLTLTVVGGESHTGHPPKGERFNQKPTMEYMETLFRRAQHATQAGDI